MASENETVAEIVGEMRGIKKRVHLNGGRAYEIFRIRCEVADEWADRIEAAHKREIAELTDIIHADERIADVIEQTYCASSSPFGETMREAAARLRKVDAIRAKLKAADYALGESRVAVCLICDKKHICGHGTEKFDPCCIYKDIDKALAAIREEGAVK